MQASTSASPFKITSHFSSAPDTNDGTNIVSQITHLVDSYLIWVGGTIERPDSLQPPPDAVGSTLTDDRINERDSVLDSRSVEALVAQAMQGGYFAKDFACAMPSKQVSTPVLGVPVFRSRDSDNSLAVSQRLARRFKKQIFLSLDVPTAVHASGQTPYFLLQVEKHLLATLKSFGEQ